MSRGFASGVRRLIAAIGAGAALAALPWATDRARGHDAYCDCGAGVDERRGLLGDCGFLGHNRACQGACDGDCFCGLMVTAAGGCTSGFETGWVRTDYILWDRDGVDLPPLATASPAGTPPAEQGILPGAEILAGDETVSDHLRSGWAIEGGLWLNACTGWALAADYFNGGRDSYGFVVGPDDGRIIARPFFNAQENAPDAKVVDSPEGRSGGVSISVFDDFQSAGAWTEKCVWLHGNACTSQGGARLSLMGGYRYYHQDSLVYVQDGFVSLANNAFGDPEGLQVLAADKFAGRNEFHGFEIGVEGRLQRCRWWCEGLASVALGGSRRVVFVEGSTFQQPQPDSSVLAFQGDLLTSGLTNFGRYADDECQVIPRFRLELGWQWTERVALHAGYRLIVWDGVVQAADHLPPDLRTDPRNLPPVQDGGGADPQFPGLQSSTLVAHGLDFGLEVNF